MIIKCSSLESCLTNVENGTWKMFFCYGFYGCYGCYGCYGPQTRVDILCSQAFQHRPKTTQKKLKHLE